MSRLKNLLIAGVLVFLTVLSADATGETKNDFEGVIQVDGLSCPFCAYGLEKKLKAVSWIEAPKIYVDDGKVEFRIRKSEPIDLDALNNAVKRGGFTANGIKFKATGSIEKSESEIILLLKDGKTGFLLDENKKREALLKELNSEPREVQVEGIPRKSNGKLFLTIEKYRLL